MTDYPLHAHDGGLVLRQHMADGQVIGIMADHWPAQFTMTDEAMEVTGRNEHDFIHLEGQIMSFTDETGFLRQYKVDPTTVPGESLAVLVNEVPPALRYRG